MKRTLRKKAAKKAIGKKPIAKIDSRHSEVDFLLLFIAVLSLFFAVLSSQALSSVLRSTAIVQAQTDAATNYIDAAETRFADQGVLNQLNSFTQPNATNK